jgi:transcriptional regulator with XRE-family HTH domain
VARTRKPTDADKELWALIGRNLRFQADRAGRTMESVAWAVGVTKGHLSRIEAGKVAPSVTMLAVLARELGVEAWELLRPLPQERRLDDGPRPEAGGTTDDGGALNPEEPVAEADRD